MSYLTRYQEAMDWLREEFNLPTSVTMYEAVVTLYEAYKEIKDKESLAKEKEKWEPMNKEKVVKSKVLKSKSKKKLKVKTT